MIQTSDYQRTNSLLSRLGDLFDPDGRAGTIARAHRDAQNARTP